MQSQTSGNTYIDEVYLKKIKISHNIPHCYQWEELSITFYTQYAILLCEVEVVLTQI